jgi:hypothetical protein
MIASGTTRQAGPGSVIGPRSEHGCDPGKRPSPTSCCSKPGCEIECRQSGRFQINSPRSLRRDVASFRSSRPHRIVSIESSVRRSTPMIVVSVPASWATFAGTRERLEALLRPAGNGSDSPVAEPSAQPAPALLLRLRSDLGKPGLASIHDELAKLELICQIELPPDLFDGVLPHELDRHRRRVSTEAPYEFRRDPEAAKLTWLAAFVHLRSRTPTDDLIDLFIETVRHIGARAEPGSTANCSTI